MIGVIEILGQAVGGIGFTVLSVRVGRWLGLTSDIDWFALGSIACIPTIWAGLAFRSFFGRMASHIAQGKSS